MQFLDLFIFTKCVQQEKQVMLKADSYYIIQNVFLQTLASVVWVAATACKFLTHLY